MGKQQQVNMKTEIDTIKITMTIEEAREFGEQMNSIFTHFSNAVNAVHGATNVEQLMLDYPAVAHFYQMLKIVKAKEEELPW